MSLEPGTRLGPYEIVALLGAGGMGAVYRARDQRLGRDVAVKVVATERATDPALLARLEQEARTAASLNHPNIVAVFDVGTHDGAPYIVSELLDGDTLRDRLASGPLPVRKAVGYASELADAVAAAHARGVVHRDLKPENVFVTSDGRPKILDFGLAKAAPAAPAAVTGAATALQTEPGVVMGTVGYMSPEQVAGRPVDHRTDIFSLGIVIDEMVTGRRLFKRDTAAQTMAAILDDDAAPASSVNANVPPTLDRIILRCLEKPAAARFQSASDLSFALSTVAFSSGHGQPPPRTRDRTRYVQIAAVVLLAASVGAAAAWVAANRPQQQSPAGVKHFTVALPAPVSESSTPLALSPDGTKLVVSLGSFQGAQLYLRSLDRPDLQPIPGTIGAGNPFFSPDGEWVGFFALSEMRKAPVSGGTVVTICRTNSLVRGNAVWAADNRIYFTPNTKWAFPSGNGLFSVHANGGDPVPVTALADGEIAHQDPDVLPESRALIFKVLHGRVTGQSGASFQRASRIVLRSLSSGEQRTLIEGASFARFSPSGHLLYLKAGTLFAAPFDLQRLTIAGPPVTISEDIGDTAEGLAQLAVSADGTFAFLPLSNTDRRSLAWVDRQGTATPLPLGERAFDTPRISPDGTRVAVLVRDKGQSDVWVQERSGALSRLTFDGVQTGLVWNTAGSAIIFSTLVDGKGAIVSQDVEGNRGSHVLVSEDRGLWPGSWSRDGRTLAYMDATNGGDVNTLRMEDSRISPFVSSPATEWGARLSLDDHWMAYASNESGRWEVYTKPYPGPGARRQISNGGGAEIVWAPSGGELFYRNGSNLMAVDVQTTPTFSAGTPRVLFEGWYAPGQPGLPGYDVSPDGQRFLMVKPGDKEAAPRSIHVIVNWFSELRRLTATAG